MRSMTNYNKSDKSKDRRGFGKREFHKPRFNNSGGRSEMFQTICAKCGKSCEVPFKPSGSKPVFCRDCYTKDPGARDPNRFQDKPTFKPNFEKRDPIKPQRNPQLDALERKVDQILKILTEPQANIE